MHINTAEDLASIPFNVKFTIAPELVDQATLSAAARHMKLATNNQGVYKLILLPGATPAQTQPQKPARIAIDSLPAVRLPGRPISSRWRELDGIQPGQTISIALSRGAHAMQYARNQATAASKRLQCPLSVRKSADGLSAEVTRPALTDVNSPVDIPVNIGNL